MKNGSAEYEALSTAMLSVSPTCQNDDRFTADVLTASQRDELQTICNRCPLVELCRAYADTVPAKTAFAGFWAGRYWGQVIA
jgi:hypothetical protein